MLYFTADGIVGSNKGGSKAPVENQADRQKGWGRRAFSGNRQDMKGKDVAHG